MSDGGRATRTAHRQGSGCLEAAASGRFVAGMPAEDILVVADILAEGSLYTESLVRGDALICLP